MTRNTVWRGMRKRALALALATLMVVGGGIGTSYNPVYAADETAILPEGDSEEFNLEALFSEQENTEEAVEESLFLEQTEELEAQDDVSVFEEKTFSGELLRGEGDTRIEVTEIEATSNINSIAVYGGQIERPTFTVTKGIEAYFASTMGGWYKKSGEEWIRVTNGNFTSGRWRFTAQIRVDGKYGSTHKLAAVTSVTVDGNAWSNMENPMISDGFSYGNTTSVEFVITGSGELVFIPGAVKDIPASLTNTSITAFSVAAAVDGGTPPYTFSKTSGPDWIMVTDEGMVSGTPVTAGANNDLVIRVTDAVGTYKEITLKVGRTALTEKIEVTEIEATSNINSIAVYGGQIKRPTFTVTKGKEAYFPSTMGNWYQKSGEDWIKVTSGNFTSGRWRVTAQIRVDGTYGLTHKLAASTSVTVDGNAWSNMENPMISDGFSYGNTTSVEFVIKEPVSGVTLDKTALSLETGKSQKLTATVAPPNASNKALTWTSSNTAVATVASDGTVKGVAAGTATITATAQDGSGKSASCTVTVKAASSGGINGFVNGPQGWGIYKNGAIDTSITDVRQNAHGWWYIQNGRVTFTFNGVARNSNGLWFIRDSKVDFNVNGVVKAGNDWYYFQGGKVQEGYNGLQKNANGWWYVEKGRVTFNYYGLVNNEYGWWYVEKSGITFKYNGVAKNQYGTWFIRDSKVDFGVNGVVKAGSTWYYFQGGKVTAGPTVKQNANGWWYIDKSGKVDYGYNGLAKNEHGWWKLDGGQVKFNYNGVARNEYGLWCVKNSKVDFSVNGLAKVREGEWYLFNGGKVREDYTGWATNVNGTWYVKNGKVDFSVPKK